MIRLATVFSGIGAIEHALARMNIPYRIVFACDSGDVDIFTKKVDSFTSDDFKNMAISDLNNTINKGEASEASTYYDVATVFGKLSDDNLIILDLLSNTQNVTKFKEAIKQELITNGGKNEATATTESESIYNEFYKYVNLK